MTTHLKAFIKAMQSLGDTYDKHRAFSDFVEMSAIAIANRDEPAGKLRDEREVQYLRAIKAYSKDELALFAELLGITALALQPSAKHCDFLGEVFMALEIANKNNGQFFTPYSLCALMAGLTIPKESLASNIASNGYVTILDPACGAGATLIATAHRINEAGFDARQHVFMTAQDIDLRSVHMCFIQLALLGVPARVIHGDSIANTSYSVWHTPARIAALNTAQLHDRYVVTTELPRHALVSSTLQDCVVFAH